MCWSTFYMSFIFGEIRCTWLRTDDYMALHLDLDSGLHLTLSCCILLPSAWTLFILSLHCVAFSRVSVKCLYGVGVKLKLILPKTIRLRVYFLTPFFFLRTNSYYNSFREPHFSSKFAPHFFWKITLLTNKPSLNYRRCALWRYGDTKTSRFCPALCACIVFCINLGVIAFELCDLWRYSLTKFMQNTMRAHSAGQISIEGGVDVNKGHMVYSAENISPILWGKFVA